MIYSILTIAAPNTLHCHKHNDLRNIFADVKASDADITEVVIAAKSLGTEIA